ncbi:hypothetical protein FNV58_01070 (plasmid) [Streptomyces sp. RLB1-9]|uniref:hypothetical protein n=1 Tax=Streptomyces sp. RLB1-9 TaxID=2594454 RepID=UPI001161D729|nr:hypothetical protein [Streptomyces sp. RLB1-9]QDN94952.1 hypothetical protein FNV58_01070 [Streptomyces sp. RLB1-9]
MTVTHGTPAPAADEEQRPVPVEIVWMHRDGTRMTGLMFMGTLPAADHAAIDATGKVDQWQITGGTRRATLDGFNDYADEQHGFRQLTPDQAARAAADWLGFTGRPVTLKILDETR